MTTITEKVTECLDYLNAFSPEGTVTLLISLDFQSVAGLVRDEMLGLPVSIPTKKIAKRSGLEPEEVEIALEALQYLVLHVAKTNSYQREDFNGVFQTTGLKPEFCEGLFVVVGSHVKELRDILA